MRPSGGARDEGWGEMIAYIPKIQSIKKTNKEIITINQSFLTINQSILKINQSIRVRDGRLHRNKSKSSSQ